MLRTQRSDIRLFLKSLFAGEIISEKRDWKRQQTGRRGASRKIITGISWQESGLRQKFAGVGNLTSWSPEWKMNLWQDMSGRTKRDLGRPIWDSSLFISFLVLFLFLCFKNYGIELMFSSITNHVVVQNIYIGGREQSEDKVEVIKKKSTYFSWIHTYIYTHTPWDSRSSLANTEEFFFQPWQFVL